MGQEIQQPGTRDLLQLGSLTRRSTERGIRGPEGAEEAGSGAGSGVEPNCCAPRPQAADLLIQQLFGPILVKRT